MTPSAVAPTPAPAGRAQLVALSLNRGELDAEKLRSLLARVHAAVAAAAQTPAR